MEFLGLISDTHINSPDQKLHPRVGSLFRGAQFILHAGDITHACVLDELETIAPVIAVRGNMDFNPGTSSLPIKKLLSFHGVSVGLIHGGGSPVGLRHRIYREFKADDPDIIVYGHTHEALIIEENGCLWVNPGSVTAPRRPDYPTVGVIRFDADGYKTEILKL